LACFGGPLGCLQCKGDAAEVKNAKGPAKCRRGNRNMRNQIPVGDDDAPTCLNDEIAKNLEQSLPLEQK
ncbi:hypothetical protein ACJ8PQ_21590, partial [Serratia sp. CY74664]|uniref:hypothetical protein n=1 Tax=Serratia sp. CY74664 TaxID=3383676 RepID=UPI003F9FFC6A